MARKRTGCSKAMSESWRFLSVLCPAFRGDLMPGQGATAGTAEAAERSGGAAEFGSSLADRGISSADPGRIMALVVRIVAQPRRRSGTSLPLRDRIVADPGIFVAPLPQPEKGLAVLWQIVALLRQSLALLWHGPKRVWHLSATSWHFSGRPWQDRGTPSRPDPLEHPTDESPKPLKCQTLPRK